MIKEATVFLGKFFGFLEQERNPEVKRLNRIEYLEKQENSKRKERDKLLVKQLGSEDDEKKKENYAIRLGNVTADIIELRRQIAKIKK